MAAGKVAPAVRYSPEVVYRPPVEVAAQAGQAARPPSLSAGRRLAGRSARRSSPLGQAARRNRRKNWQPGSIVTSLDQYITDVGSVLIEQL
jgi:hypothetical protein